MKSTQYLPYGDATDVFARTYPGSKIVWVNTLSMVFQALPGATFYQNLRIGGVSAMDSGIYGLLHELSHQLTPETGAVSDETGFNFWNTLRVMNACPGR